jgi:hypothetical protein
MRDIRKKAVPMVLALSMALVPACGSSESGQQATGPTEEQTEQSMTATASWDAEKSLPVYRDSMTSAESVTVYMRGDIPYMKIDEFYNKLYFTGAENYPEQASPMVLTHEGSVYEAPAFDGTKATFDVDTDVFTCENLDTYTNAPYYSLYLADRADPSAPFVRISHTDYSGDVTPTSVALADYGIDVIASGDDLWVPLPTLECIFCSPYGYNVSYNGSGIYVSDAMQVLQATNAKDEDEAYFAFTENDRSTERVDFDYNNLCFYVDTFYGHPASCRISESIAEVGLDKTLDETIDGMNLTGIKELLKSTSMSDYDIGLMLLFNYAFSDGGHTGFADFTWLPQEQFGTIREKLTELNLTPNETQQASEMSGEALTAAFAEALETTGATVETMEYADGGGSAVYMEQGDTAMFVVSGGYNIDRPAWTAFEEGSSTEMPVDSMGTFMQALERAKANPEIKNFVVNIANCVGGESGISATISKIICKTAYRHQFDELTGQDEVIHYDIDANFDGTFDERDDVSYPFNFAVVAASPAYSAANYLANMAKDNGVCLLGETTGGGANSPQLTPESEGMSFLLSGRYKLMDKNGKHVDFGVEPDYVLTEESDGQKDYSSYFDLEAISRYVNEFYSD